MEGDLAVVVIDRKTDICFNFAAKKTKKLKVGLLLDSCVLSECITSGIHAGITASSRLLSQRCSSSVRYFPISSVVQEDRKLSVKVENISARKVIRSCFGPLAIH
ncbi:hypothetical protein CFP56_021645 [Quercus suber]|uniref:Uncharacterized protein n=1 Tax=Quercus suber TaxID=58331 RepID=A0AAW0KCK9_QUESU